MSKRMRNVKLELCRMYGCRCEVCKREFKFKNLTGHHIIEKSKGGKITLDNIMLACYDCHFKRINHIKYNSKEYHELMTESLAHRKEANSD